MKRRWPHALAAVFFTALSLVVFAPGFIVIGLWLHNLADAPLFLHEQGEAAWWFEPVSTVLLALWPVSALLVGWKVWRRGTTSTRD